LKLFNKEIVRFYNFFNGLYLPKTENLNSKNFGRPDLNIQKTENPKRKTEDLKRQIDDQKVVYLAYFVFDKLDWLFLDQSINLK
jgi:hypothetical protein